MKTYMVKEIFGPTIQGEGSLAGSVTAFLRFTGCNVWDGRAESKEASGCPYCDTDFVGGERLDLVAIVERLLALLPQGGLVTVSGGEPLLQLDEALAHALCDAGFRVAIETNGTKAIGVGLSRYIAHVTCSPKVPRSEVQLGSCDDLKVLYPHPNPKISPEAFGEFFATRRFLQPINGAGVVDDANMKLALAKCYELAREGQNWSLGLQLHKMIGVA